MSGTIFSYSYRGQQVEIGKLASDDYIVVALEEGEQGGAVVMPKPHALSMARAILESAGYVECEILGVRGIHLVATREETPAREPIMPPPTRPAPPMPKVKQPRAETVEEMADRAHAQTNEAVRRAALLMHCHLPQPGWACTRGAGHPGPCATVEDEDFREVDAEKWGVPPWAPKQPGPSLRAMPSMREVMGREFPRVAVSAPPEPPPPRMVGVFGETEASKKATEEWRQRNGHAPAEPDLPGASQSMAGYVLRGVSIGVAIVALIYAMGWPG